MAEGTRKGISRRDFFRQSAVTGAGIAAAHAVPSAGEASEVPAEQQNARKVLIMSDMEGVGGIFSAAGQCNPLKSPRWRESQKLLTGEVNAAVDGLFAGGATEVIVWDSHDGGQALSASDIHPKARVLIGSPIPPIREFDSTFSAIIFIGQHAMAGAKDSVLSHSFSFNIQNLWVNGRLVGEIGIRAMVAGEMGVPAIMLAGDTAACREIRELIPQAECAEVKSAVSSTAGYTLPHPSACELIRNRAERAMKRLAEFKPHRVEGPVEVKVEFTTSGDPGPEPRRASRRIDERTVVYTGKSIIEAWFKFGRL
ncbi:MAG TPA: M55 family metallopeptidase [Terriglobia bacterium]|nr:M55 family metallopeptidase [Terriglobia bacterium]